MTQSRSHVRASHRPDGMTFSDKGELYYGGVTTDALYVWDPESGKHSVVSRDPQRLRWIDTFAWDGQGNLWGTRTYPLLLK